MSLAQELSPHLSSATCYLLIWEVRNEDSRRIRIIGVHERVVHAVAALRNLRLRIYPGSVAAFDEEGMEFPNGNQMGPLQNPEDSGDHRIGWGYRFRDPRTRNVSTIWIEQRLIFLEAPQRPPVTVNWTELVASSRIDISDDTTNGNGHADLSGSSHGFVEELENDQDDGAMENIRND